MYPDQNQHLEILRKVGIDHIRSANEDGEKWVRAFEIAGAQAYEDVDFLLFVIVYLRQEF